MTSNFFLIIYTLCRVSYKIWQFRDDYYRTKLMFSETTCTLCTCLGEIVQYSTVICLVLTCMHSTPSTLIQHTSYISSRTLLCLLNYDIDLYNVYITLFSVKFHFIFSFFSCLHTLNPIYSIHWRIYPMLYASRSDNRMLQIFSFFIKWLYGAL